MSASTDNPRRRIRVRYLAIGGAVITLLALVAVVLNGNGGNGPSSYEASRAAYEKALLDNPNRVDGDFGVQIHDDAGGAVYTYETTVLMVRAKDGSLKNECEYRCMVGHKTADGYAVTLPVAFSYRAGMQSFSPISGSQPVTELTYWDPQQHRAVTLRAPKGGVVTLPKALYGRNIDNVRNGETVYTVPEFVRNNGSSTVVLNGMTVWTEPGGYLYGMTDLARLTKTKAGFDVCLPGNYQPIYERGVRGLTAHVLNGRC